MSSAVVMAWLILLPMNIQHDPAFLPFTSIARCEEARTGLEHQYPHSQIVCVATEREDR